MSDTAPAAPQQTVTEPNGAATSTTSEPNGEPEEIDFKAKYEEAIGHSRKWESQAKANKDAADELQKLKDAQKTAEQKQAEHLQALERENAAFRAEAQQRQWAAEVATETGVPAEVLRGSTREEIEAHAALLKPAYEAPKAPADPVKTVGQQPTPSGNMSLADQIATAEAAGEKNLVAVLKAQQLGSTN